MKFKMIAVLVVVALVLCAVTVMAQRGRQAGKPAGAPAMGAPGQGMGQGMGMGMMCERMKAELGLTPDQVTQLQAICADCKASTQGAREDIQAMMKQMPDLWAADQPNADAIKDLAARMDSARAQIRNIAIDHAVAAFAVLSADQKAKVRAFVGKNPGMCMGMCCGVCGGPGAGCGMGQGMGPGAGMGCGMGQGMGPGAGCGMGQGKGPGAGGAKCPFTK